MVVVLRFELHIDGAMRGGYDHGLCLDEKICRVGKWRWQEKSGRKECGSSGNAKGEKRDGERSLREEEKSRKKIFEGEVGNAKGFQND